MIAIVPSENEWKPPPRRLILERDTVHVWRVSLAQPQARIQTFLQLCTPDERARAEAYHFQRDRERFIAARGALRTILARYLPRTPEQLRFTYSRYGKPALLETMNERGLRFNISHAHELALCAVTRGREVGVDIEFIREDFASLDIAGRFFSQAEVAALRALPPGAQTLAFFNCWTRKEAYIKARGEGLSHPLDCFTVSLIPGEPARLLSTKNDPQEVSHWCLHELATGAGYAAAIAVEGGPCRLDCWQWL
jgi:4'-phosphopantetheinyl transferase